MIPPDNPMPDKISSESSKTRRETFQVGPLWFDHPDGYDCETWVQNVKPIFVLLFLLYVWVIGYALTQNLIPAQNCSFMPDLNFYVFQELIFRKAPLFTYFAFTALTNCTCNAEMRLKNENSKIMFMFVLSCILAVAFDFFFYYVLKRPELTTYGIPISAALACLNIYFFYKWRVDEIRKECVERGESDFGGLEKKIAHYRKIVRFYIYLVLVIGIGFLGLDRYCQQIVPLIVCSIKKSLNEKSCACSPGDTTKELCSTQEWWDSEATQEKSGMVVVIVEVFLVTFFFSIMIPAWKKVIAMCTERFGSTFHLRDMWWTQLRFISNACADACQFLFGRGLLLTISSSWLLFVFIAKDFLYHMFNFYFKFHTYTFEFSIAVFHPKEEVHSEKMSVWTRMAIRFIEFISILLWGQAGENVIWFSAAPYKALANTYYAEIDFEEEFEEQTQDMFMNSTFLRDTTDGLKNHSNLNIRPTGAGVSKTKNAVRLSVSNQCFLLKNVPERMYKEKQPDITIQASSSSNAYEVEEDDKEKNNNNESSSSGQPDVNPGAIGKEQVGRIQSVARKIFGAKSTDEFFKPRLRNSLDGWMVSNPIMKNDRELEKELLLDDIRLIESEEREQKRKDSMRRMSIALMKKKKETANPITKKLHRVLCCIQRDVYLRYQCRALVKFATSVLLLLFPLAFDLGRGPTMFTKDAVSLNQDNLHHKAADEHDIGQGLSIRVVAAIMFLVSDSLEYVILNIGFKRNALEYYDSLLKESYPAFMNIRYMAAIGGTMAYILCHNFYSKLKWWEVGLINDYMKTADMGYCGAGSTVQNYGVNATCTDSAVNVTRSFNNWDEVMTVCMGSR